MSATTGIGGASFRKSEVKRVAIRVDASVRIGYGHFIRCGALAVELSKAGAEIHFLAAELDESLISSARDAGHDVSLFAPYGDLLDSDPNNHEQRAVVAERDASRTLSVLELGAPDILVVDHYALGPPWESRMRSLGCRIVCIDDLADREHDCDLLVDQNPGRVIADYEGLLPHHAQRLLGPQFALLRRQFAEARAKVRPESSGSDPRRILISVGGTDPHHVTEQVLVGLDSSGFPSKTNVRILMGGTAPGREDVIARAAKSRFDCEILVNPPGIAAVMAECDIAIGAGGVSALERCCLGVPSWIIVVADNQRPGALSLVAEGAALGVLERSKVQESVAALDPDLPTASEVSSAGMRLVDGLGAARVSRAVMELLNG